MVSQHKKRIWYTAAVGGMAGLTGIAGVNHVAMGSGSSHQSEMSAAAKQVTDTTDGKDNATSGSTDSSVVKVPCDPEDLTRAIHSANGKGGGSFELARRCTYTLTQGRPNVLGQLDGLPTISQPITIDGNNAILQRAAGLAGTRSEFRIFDVGPGGSLTLKDATVRYGVGTGTAVPSGGGGLLVQPGGSATLVDVSFVLNRSNGVGGAIANFGITKIMSDSKDGPGGEDDSSSQGPNTPWAKNQSDGSEEMWSGEGGDRRSVIVNNNAHGVGTGGLGGGGIFNAKYLTVEATRIAYNVTAAGVDGGGLATDDGGVSQLRRVSVDHNRAADDGGGIANVDRSTTTLDHTWVTFNTSGGNGGGVENSGDVTTPPSVYLNHSSVLHNSADRDGGGIDNDSGTLVADHSSVNENTASRVGAGLLNQGGAAALLRHSEVNLNKAIGTSDAAGGGIWNSMVSELHLTASTVAENLSTGSAGGIQNFNLLHHGQVTGDDESAITKNRPTNCTGMPAPFCFG